MAGARSGILGLALLAVSGAAGVQADGFDHSYALYAEVLRTHAQGPAVDYARLKADRTRLDAAVAALAAPAARTEPQWSRAERMAFWINAYNILTLRAIVDHYPIRAGWFTRLPRNSIRQIDGVWTRLTWQAGGRTVTLDDIEHRILRPVFADARIHFAINCASVSCPPLLGEPYRPETLETQLDDAARRYLASPEGAQRAGETLRVSSIFKWYGGDFVERYAPLVRGKRSPTDRAILGVLMRHGPEWAASRAKIGMATIAYIDYNWSLNDIPATSLTRER